METPSRARLRVDGSGCPRTFRKPSHCRCPGGRTALSTHIATPAATGNVGSAESSIRNRGPILCRYSHEARIHRQAMAGKPLARFDRAAARKGRCCRCDRWRKSRRARLCRWHRIPCFSCRQWRAGMQPCRKASVPRVRRAGAARCPVHRHRHLGDPRGGCYGDSDSRPVRPDRSGSLGAVAHWPRARRLAMEA